MSEIEFTSDQLARHRELRERNARCPSCGKPPRHTLVEYLAREPEVVTICDQCGILQRKAL